LSNYQRGTATVSVSRIIVRGVTHVARFRFHSGGERYDGTSNAGWTLALSMRKNRAEYESDVDVDTDVAVGGYGNMYQHVVEVSTEVFHLLQKRAPGFVEWAEEKSGPIQKIVLPDDVYNEFIDRAIHHRQTLDEVVREVCTRPQKPVSRDRVSVGKL